MGLETSSDCIDDEENRVGVKFPTELRKSLMSSTDYHPEAGGVW